MPQPERESGPGITGAARKVPPTSKTEASVTPETPYTADVARTIVSASPEVLEHHDARHRARCPGDGAVPMSCSHGTTVLVACSSCHEAVFAAVAPGVPCHHAGEVLGGLRPTGIWTEVDR